MRFAFVLPNLAGGGAEKAVLKTARALAASHHQVDIFVLEKKAAYPLDPAISVHFVAEKLLRGWLGKRILAFHLRRALTALTPDLLVSTLPFADEVTALTGLPRHYCRIANTLSAEIRKLQATSPQKAKRRLARYRDIYARRALIAVSAGVADDLRNEMHLPSRIEVIPNPFDFRAIREAAAARHEVRYTQDYVVHVGRFSAQKRHDLLLDAWVQLSDAPDLILLTEPSPALQRMIAERGLSGRVHIAGFQFNPYPWMAGARLLVLCSDHEGLPNVLIEALICGTPVVSTNCPSGPAEILASMPEALVKCDDASALAEQIRQFLRSPPDISRIDLDAYDMRHTIAAYECLAAKQGGGC